MELLRHYWLIMVGVLDCFIQCLLRFFGGSKIVKQSLQYPYPKIPNTVDALDIIHVSNPIWKEPKYNGNTDCLKEAIRLALSQPFLTWYSNGCPKDISPEFDFWKIIPIQFIDYHTTTGHNKGFHPNEVKWKPIPPLIKRGTTSALI